jgi:hypothetical protein
MTTDDTTDGQTPPTPLPHRFVARGPDDLIAFVPVALGFEPAESVSMLTFGGPSPFHARVDLPDDVDEADLVVDTLLAPARQHRVERVAFVVHGDDTAVADELGWSLAAAFTGVGIDVIDVLRVHDGRWFAMLPGHPTGHYDGVPLAAAHPFAAQSVVAGRVTHGSREELRASLAPDPDAVAAVEAAVQRQRPEAAACGPGAVGRLVRDHVVGHSRCTDDEVAALALALLRTERRDEAWAVTEREAAAFHVDFWSDVCRRCPDDLVAAPAAVLGVAAWLAGNGALAWCAVDRCRAVEPEHSLAALVADILQSATPPTVWDRVRPALVDAGPGEGAA